MGSASTTMRIRRTAVNVHRWIALLVGVQILLWIAGGVVMSVLPIETVRGEHKLAEHPPLTFDPSGILSLEDASAAASMADLSRARLSRLGDRPVWRLQGTDGRRSVVDAGSGAVLSPFDAASAERIARSAIILDTPVTAVARVENARGEYLGAVPAWRVEFDDDDATTLYVDALEGVVTARRSTTWRFYDLFWRLHVMDYDDGADFNHPLIMAASVIALLVASSGLVLLFLRMRQSLLTTLAVRRRSAARRRDAGEPGAA